MADENNGLTTPVPKRTVTFSTGGLGTNTEHPILTYLQDGLYHETREYIMSFDYKINEKYTGGTLEFIMTNSNLSSVIRKSAFSGNGQYYNRPTNAEVLFDIELEGNEGSMEVRMNDYEEFRSILLSRGNLLSIGHSQNLGVYYTTNNHFVPFVSVYDEIGRRFSLTHLDYNVTTPTTTEGLETLSGYLTNFQITVRNKW